MGVRTVSDALAALQAEVKAREKAVTYLKMHLSQQVRVGTDRQGIHGDHDCMAASTGVQGAVTQAPDKYRSQQMCVWGGGMVYCYTSLCTAT